MKRTTLWLYIWPSDSRFKSIPILCDSNQDLRDPAPKQPGKIISRLPANFATEPFKGRYFE